jgi:HK97 family phage major capsid protein
MKTSLELRQEQAEATKKAKALKDAPGGLTEESVKQFNSLMDTADGLDPQIKDTEKLEARIAGVDSCVADLDKSAGRTVPPGSPDSRIEVKDPEWMKDPMRGFRHGPAFLLSVKGYYEGGSSKLTPQLKSLGVPKMEATAGSDEGSTFANPYGGFLLPEGVQPGIRKVDGEGDPTIGRTFQYPMEMKTFKVNSLVSYDHTTTSSGGLRVYRRAEALEVTASKLQFEQITLDLMEMMGIAYDTEEILRWSPLSFVTMLQQGFNTEFQAKTIKEKISGTGVGQFQGALNSPALITVDKETDQTAGTIIFENILNMKKRCFGYGNAVWLANNDTQGEFPKLNVNVPGSGVALVWMPSAVEGAPERLLGRPLIFTDWCKTLGNKGDIILADWSQFYECYDARNPGIQAAESVHVRFLTNERCFRFLTLNDGKFMWTTYYTPPNSTVTRSPIVTLAERA